MRKEVDSGRLGTETDVSFHMAFSYATKNPVRIHLMNDFFDFLFVGLKTLYKNPTNIDRIISQHSQIYSAVKDHNEKEAFEATRSHIEFVLNFFRRRKPQ